MSLIVLDSFIGVNKKCYPQTLFKKCEYKIKKNELENLTNDDLDPSSSGSESNESDNESDNGSDNGPVNQSENGSDNESDNDESNGYFVKN